MADMKKHLFLKVEVASTVKLSVKQSKEIQAWLSMASAILEKSVSRNLFGKKRKFKSLEVSLLLCGDQRIKKLNQHHREKNKVTDVLSFPAHEDLRNLLQNMPEVLFLGDLAICWPQTKRQAHQHNIRIMDEFIHLFFHGLLHLIGYDHELSKVEEKLMQKWEDDLLSEFSQKKKRGA
jgi:probable rRNA maturation factor